jgi:hypothetical protein
MKFGQENVKTYSTPEGQLLLYKDPKDNKWHLPEPLETLELADFTSDMAREIIPTAASIGIAALTRSPAGIVLGGAGGYSSVGALQDYLVLKQQMPEVDVGEIISRRTKEGLLLAGLDATMMGMGKLFMGFLGRQGTDLFNSQMDEFARVTSGGDTLTRAPFLQQGGNKAETALRIESKFPNGGVAKSIDERRTVAGQEFEGTLAPSGAEVSEDALREGLDHISESLMKQRGQLQGRLAALQAEREGVETTARSAAEKKAQQEAQKLFNARVQQYEKDVLPERIISPAKAGGEAQNSLANQFVDVTIQKSRNFNEAYDLLTNLSTPINDLNRVFKNSSRELLTDIEGDAIRILNASARNTSETALKSLDDLASAGGSIDFKSVNELIQKIEEKTRRGNFVAGFDANQYRQLADDLRQLRSKMLAKPEADAQGVAQFEFANTFYRDKYLPYIGGEIGGMIKPKLGQSFSEALEAKLAGKEVVMPPLEQVPDTVLPTILKNSGTTQRYLELSGGGMETRQLLRDAWLQSKGLRAGDPIDVNKILNMNEADMDMVRVLWREGQQGSPQKGVAGWNDKVETFRQLKKLAKDKDNQIVELSKETFERIMNAGSKQEQEALRKIALQEQTINNQLAEQSQTMVKLANEGRIPLPENRVQMKTFLKGLMGASPAEQQKFIKLIKDSGKGLDDDLSGALYNEMLRRSRKNTELVTAGSPKDNVLWDAFEMERQLESNMELITGLVGKQGYDNLVTLNTTLRNLTRRIDYGKDEAVPRVALTPSGFNLWVGNITAPVTDRIGAVIMGLQANSPVPLKKVVSGQTYDQIQNMMIRSAFLTDRGLLLLNSEAEDSPEMNKFLAEQLQDIRGEQRRLQESMAQEQLIQQEQAAPVQ